MPAKVSIILPCYNVQQFLDRCINSLLSNNYQDYEIICIDDGSTDGTALKLDNYAKEDDRIKVFHKNNGGVASARNEGIKRANGKYIMFVDPDDYVDNKFLELPLNAIESSNADLCIFGYYVVSSADHSTDIRKVLPKSNYNFSRNIDIIKYLFPKFIGRNINTFNKFLRGESSVNDEKEFEVIWRWVYDKNFLNNNKIIFKNIKIGEDCIFISNCLLYANKVCCVEKPLYYYQPVETGASLQNRKGKDIYINKNNLLKERKKILDIYNNIKPKNMIPEMGGVELIAGSCIFSVFELAVRLSSQYNNKNYKQYISYVKDPIVQKSIELGKVSLKKIKYGFPFLLLKLKLYRTIYTLFYILNKMNFKINL